MVSVIENKNNMEQIGPTLEQTQDLSQGAASSKPDASIPAASLDAVQLEKPLAETTAKPEVIVITPRGSPWIRWTFVGLTILLVITGGIFLTKGRQGSRSQLESGHFGTITLPLKQLQVSTTVTNAAQKLQINGQLQVAGSIVLSPASQPSNPQSGQIYFDKTTKQVNYYDGQKFQAVGNGNVTNVTNITNVLSGTGAGVRLQAASPGSQQIGHFNISGTGVVGRLQTTVISSDGGTLYINPVGATAQQSVSAGTPAKAGLSDIGSIAQPGPGWANDLSATKVTMGNVGGTAVSISVYYSGGSSSNHVQLALFDDDGDIPSKPGNLLAASAVGTLVPNGWTTLTISGVNLSANASYWLATNTDDNTVGRAANGGNKVSCFISSSFGFMPDPFSPFGCFYDNNDYSIYLNYLAGAGASGSLSQAQMVIGATGQVLFQNTDDSSTAFRVQNSAGTSTIFNIDTLNGRIGIGKTTPTFKLDIAAGDVNLSNGRSIRFGGLPALSTNSAGTTTSITNFVPGGKVSAQADNFVIQDANATHQSLSIDSNGAAIFSNRTDSTTGFQIQNAANSTTVLNVDTTNKIVTVSSLVSTGNITVSGHIITSGTAPGIAAGTAACTTPTVSVSGNDTSGIITVTTGTGCAASGTLATISFATAFGAAPHVLLTPGSSTALTLGAYVDDATITTNSFVLGTNSAPINSTAYKWNYEVLQ
jgi:hypothetical protein